MQTKIKRTYPKGLFSASIVNAGNMVGLTMINALLVLYCTSQLQMPVKDAYALYAAFGAIFYSASLLGGYLGGRYDYVLSIMLGCVLAGGGTYFLVSNDLSSIYLGLSCFIVGCGLIVPNIYCIIGKLYAKDDKGRDSGFTIAYMLTNVGGATTALSSGYLVNLWGFHFAFALSATIVLLSLLLFLITFKHYQYYGTEKIKPYRPNLSWRKFFPMFMTIVIAVPIIKVLLNYARISNFILIALGICTVFIVLSLALQEKGKSKKRLLAFLIFIIIGTAFWALYMLAPSALTIFIKNNVQRTIGNITIPTPVFYGLNPVFIISVGSLTSFFFLWLAKHKKNFSLPWKFSLGIISMGCGYLALFVGIHYASSTGMVVMWWIVLSYFLQSFGELFVAPISLAMVGTLCPARYEGLMTGVFRLSVGFAGAISGFLAEATAAPKTLTHAPLLTNPIYSHAFGWYGSITVVIGIVIMLLVPQFRKLWR